MRRYPRKIFSRPTVQDVLLKELKDAIKGKDPKSNLWLTVARDEERVSTVGSRHGPAAAKIAYAIAAVVDECSLGYGAWWRRMVDSEERGFWPHAGPGSMYWQWEWLAEAVAYSRFGDDKLAGSLSRHAAFFSLVSREIEVDVSGGLIPGVKDRGVIRGCRIAGVNSCSDSFVANPASYIGSRMFCFSKHPPGPERFVAESVPLGCLYGDVIGLPHFFDVGLYLDPSSIQNSTKNISSIVEPRLHRIFNGFNGINTCVKYTIEIHLDGTVVTYIGSDIKNGKPCVWYAACREELWNSDFVYPYLPSDLSAPSQSSGKWWNRIGGKRVYHARVGSGKSVKYAMSEPIGQPVVSFRFSPGSAFEVVYG